MMKRLIAIGAAAGLGVLPSAVLGAPLDGSVSMLCALNFVMECSRKGDCERSAAEESGIPTFIRVNVPQRQLSSLDGARTSPIANVLRSNGNLMFQGMQNERVWGTVIDEATGKMSATAAEADGAFVLIGTCVAP
jgi:hypothetical protein